MMKKYIVLTILFTAIPNIFLHTSESEHTTPVARRPCAHLSKRQAYFIILGAAAGGIGMVAGGMNYSIPSLEYGGFSVLGADLLFLLYKGYPIGTNDDVRQRAPSYNRPYTSMSEEGTSQASVSDPEAL